MVALQDDLTAHASRAASARRWRQQAANLREHAGRLHLTQSQREQLLREADAADRQAAWWSGAAGTAS